MNDNIKIGKRYRHHLLKKPNVVGVGVGYREKGGRRTDERAVIVFVTQKVAPHKLAGAEMVPRSLRGQRVDVIEIGAVSYTHLDVYKRQDMGSEAVRDLIKYTDVKQVTIADLNTEAADKLAAAIGDKRVVVKKVDATSHEDQMCIRDSSPGLSFLFEFRFCQSPWRLVP